jgi:hypothetical protein
VALGTGTIHGKDALVVVTEAPDGSYSYRAVTTSPCEINALS